MNHGKIHTENIALVYAGKIISCAAVTTRRDIICKKLKWRKLYGPQFRKCDIIINFNFKNNGTDKK
jgi:hypothetical protein